MNFLRIIFLGIATVVTYVCAVVAIVLGFLTVLVGALAAVWWIITALVEGEGSWFINWNSSLTLTMIVLGSAVVLAGLGLLAMKALAEADWTIRKTHVSHHDMTATYDGRPPLTSRAQTRPARKEKPVQRPPVKVNITPEGGVTAGPFNTPEEAQASMDTIKAIKDYVERNQQ